MNYLFLLEFNNLMLLFSFILIMGDRLSKKKCTICGCHCRIMYRKMSEKSTCEQTGLEKSFVKNYEKSVSIEDLGKTLPRPGRPKRPNTLDLTGTSGPSKKLPSEGRVKFEWLPKR